MGAEMERIGAIKTNNYLYNTIEYLIFVNNLFCGISFYKSSLKYLE